MNLPRLELSSEQNSQGKNEFIIFRNDFRRQSKKSLRKNKKSTTHKRHTKSKKHKKGKKTRKNFFNIFT